MLNKAVDVLPEIIGGKVDEGRDGDQEEQGGKGVRAGVFNMV